MTKYIQLHIDFLFSRVMMMVMVFALVITQLGMIYASNVSEGYLVMDAYKALWSIDFMNELLMVYEFVFVFLAIYVAIHLGSRNNQALMSYTVDSKKTKFLFIISRFFSGLLLVSLLLFVMVLTIFSYTFAMTPYALPIKQLLYVYGFLYLEVIQYYVLTLLLMMVLGHMLMGLMSFLLFWLLEVMNTFLDKNGVKYIEILTINVKTIEHHEKSLVFFCFLYIFLIISYIIILVKRDC